MDLLEDVLLHYGLEVPIPSGKVGGFTRSYWSQFDHPEWTGYRYA